MKIETKILKQNASILTIGNISRNGLYVTQFDNGRDAINEMILVVDGQKIVFNNNYQAQNVTNDELCQNVRVRPAVAGESITLTV